MKSRLLICLVLVVATDASAHRLDEYLQASRIAVATNHIELSIDLTPGVAILPQLLIGIDKDHDGRVSEEEMVAYAQDVLKDIQVRLDEKPLALSLVKATFPSLDEIKEGLGVIRVKATGSVGQFSPGKHALSLTNAHLPAMSVYLVNALVPKDPAIKVTKQTRDALQRNYRLEFGVILPSP